MMIIRKKPALSGAKPENAGFSVFIIIKSVLRQG